MVAAFKRGTFGTGVVRGNGLALQQSGVVSLGTVAIPGDTNFASNVLLAKTTSVNSATNNTFLDSSSNALSITRNGNPTQGSFTPYWPSGYWSGYFDDSLSSYLTTTSATAFSFSSGDWTIECWANFNGITDSNGDALVTVGDSASNRPICFYRATTNQIFVDLSTGGANFTQIPFNVTLNPGTWYHIAVVRSSNIIYCYVNGNSVGTPTAYSSTLASYTGNVYIGRIPWNPASDLPGYISNLRIVKGTAVYTGAFTPSTTPLTAIANTSLLTCQDNRFKDNSVNALTITATGSPKIQAFQPFNPPAAYSTSTHGSSGYFNGGTSDKLSIASNASLALGTGDFTIEMWVYNQSTTNRMLTWPTVGAPIIYYDTSNFLKYENYGAATILTSSIAVPLHTWAHIVICRASSVSKIFINGVQAASGADSNNWGQNGINIGADLVSTYMTGYISNLRVVKGTAVYTSAFTPPTAPVTAIANTLLLANFTNAGIYDTTVQNDAVTVGDAQVSTTVYKWSPTSMKFDGTGDYLTTPSNPALALRTGDFTVEFWMYPTAAQTGDIIDTRVSGDSANSWCVQLDNTNINFTGPGSNYLSYPYTLNTWTHVAYTRVSGSVSVYINGTKYGSSVTLTNDFTGTVYKIGATFNNFYYAGYIQDLRVTRGLARYTANFTAPTTTFSNSTASTFTPAVPDAPIIANLTTITNTSVKIGYMAPLLNGGSTITSYTAVSTPGGITGTSVTSRSGTITVNGLLASNTYTFAVYATNAIGTSTFSASSKSVTTPVAQLGRIFILSDMDLALTNLVLLNTTVASGILKAKTYALATIYGSD
jgi:hypothetical protein